MQKKKERKHIEQKRNQIEEGMKEMKQKVKEKNERKQINEKNRVGSIAWLSFLR